MDEKAILLQLCAQAPIGGVKNCLRIWDSKYSTKQLTKMFANSRVGELIATLEYLQAPNLRQNLNDYTKQGLILNVICRIENLLPDKCVHCEEIYCTKMSDKSLLPCEKCGQEPHMQCLINKLGVESSAVDQLTQESVRHQLNPLGLNGWTYICHACKSDYIPNQDQDVKQSVLRKDQIPQSSSTGQISTADITVSQHVNNSPQP